MSEKFHIPDDVHEHVADALLGKSWSEVECLEFADRLLFPAELQKRKADGSFERLPVMLRVPRAPEIRKARLAARKIAQKEGLDERLDSGAIEDLETFEILAIAIRNTTDPHEPMFPFEGELEKLWDKSSLVKIWAELDALHHVIDPAPDTIGEAEMLALTAKLAKDQNLGPLVVYASGAQVYYVTTMAARYMNLLASQLSQESSEDSTPES